MKFLIVIAAFGLVGCCPPNIRPDFPSIPPSLEIQCPELALVPDTEKLSNVVEVVVSNYKEYHLCKEQVNAWKTWYSTQQKIYNGDR